MELITTKAPSVIGLEAKSHVYSFAELRALACAVHAVRGYPICVPFGLDGKWLGLIRSDWTREVWFSPFNNWDDMLTKIANKQRRSRIWSKNVGSWTLPFTNRWLDLWTIGGDPVGGSYAGGANSAFTFDDNVTGAMSIGGAVNPLTKHITGGWVETGSAQNGVTYLYDRVLTYEQCTINGTTITLNNGNTAGRYISAGQQGLMIMPTVQTVISFVGTGGFSVMTYVNQNGTAGQTCPVNTTDYQFEQHGQVPSNTVPAEMAMVDNNNASIPFMPLQAGDSGVRSITNFTTAGGSIGTNTGKCCIVLMRPLVLMATSGTQKFAMNDWTKGFQALVQVYDHAHLTFLSYWNASTSSNFIGGIDIGWG